MISSCSWVKFILLLLTEDWVWLKELYHFFLHWSRFLVPTNFAILIQSEVPNFLTAFDTVGYILFELINVIKIITKLLFWIFGIKILKQL